jgi:hydrogenase-4 component H
MWLSSKLRQLALVLRPGVVTLKYPAMPRAAPREFRGPPRWDHHKCVGCGGCAAHCPARTILVRDLCQDLRVMLYDGSRCTYCGRCADLCPEKAIAMGDQFELATDDRNDLTVSLELFMLTCQRCGRCYNLETRNVIDKMDLKGFRYDNLEMRAVLPRATERFEPRMLAESDRYQRPPRQGEQ